MFFEVNREELIDDSAWVHLDAIESGSERVARRMFSTEGLTFVPVLETYDAFIDREAGGRCQPYGTPVGLVCIPGYDHPRMGNYGLFYADADGQQQLLPDLDWADIVVRRSEPASTKCGAPRTLESIEAAYPIGDKYDGPVFDEDDVELDPSTLADTAYYLVGPALDLSSFGALEESIE